jgi:hypothetical protein
MDSMKVEIQQYIVELTKGKKTMGDSFCVTRCISHDNSVTWKISDGDYNITRDGKWIREPLPSARTNEFFAVARFSLDEAFNILDRMENET